MLASAVVGSVAFVPDICKLAHGGRFLSVQPFQEAVVDHLAVVSSASCIDADGSANLPLMRCHDVDQIPQGLCGVVALADVNMDFMESNA